MLYTDINDHIYLPGSTTARAKRELLAYAFLLFYLLFARMHLREQVGVIH
jgi:hypothetical protein